MTNIKVHPNTVVTVSICGTQAEHLEKGCYVGIISTVVLLLVVVLGYYYCADETEDGGILRGARVCVWSLLGCSLAHYFDLSKSRYLNEDVDNCLVN